MRLMLAYQGDAEDNGAMVAFKTPLLGGKVLTNGFELEVGGDEPATIRCRYLINAAGLHAPALARSIEGIPLDTIPPAYFCRGCYFTLAGKTPFTRLIYPVPVPGGLGCTSPSTWRGRRGSAPMSNGSTGWITRSIRAGATRSMPQCGVIGRD